MTIPEQAAAAVTRRGYRHPTHDLDAEILRTHTDPARLGVCRACGDPWPCDTLRSLL